MWVGTALVGAAGCTTRATSECVADDGCSNGTRCRDGVCVATGTGVDGGGGRTDGGPGVDDGGPVAGDGGTADAAPHNNGDAGLSCVGADDGVLTAVELPLSLGVPLRMVASGSVDGGVAVNLAGTIAGDGVLVWDFSGALPGDESVTITAEPLAGKWFETEFADGGYVAPLDGTGDNLGIYQRSETQVVLLGVASRTPDDTLLKHDPPVTVLRLPITLGQSFSTVTQTRGTLQGNAFYSSTDTYDFLVDGRGRVKTPAGEFSTLRVRTEQTVVVPILIFPFTATYHWWRYTFLSSCYSTVAAVGSLQGEDQPEFTRASEVRRLGLP